VDQITSEEISREDMLRMAADVVSSYVSRNVVARAEVPEVISTVYSSLNSLHASKGAEPASTRRPAVPIRRSVTPDHIICLEDGRKLKMLKRYLRTNFGMTPQEYRAKWRLPPDYPMVAPSYAKRRSEFAKQIGLGRTPGKPRESENGG
jgi:predicted transcriptional regulator